VFGSGRREQELKFQIATIERQKFMAEGRWLDSLRRELALWLIDTNPSAFEEAYYKARGFDTELRKASADRISAERNALAQKYPFFIDFDLVGLKHFVPFEGEMDTELDIVLRYLDISKMLTLLSIEDASYDIQPFSDRDEEVFRRVIDRKKHRALQQHIDIAMGRYYAFQRDRQDAPMEFSDRDYSVCVLPHVAELRYGITVKADGQRGIYSQFFGDDKAFTTYYEADERFEEKHPLWLR
jgi:hypothetical protein